MGVRTIRAGRGLGDSIYLHSIVRALGGNLHVQSDHPDVFSSLGVKVSPHNRKADLVAHYVTRKRYQETTQFEDMCISVGIRKPVELRIDWRAESFPGLKSPYVIVQMPRAPMGRTDGFGASLFPDCRRMQEIINHLRGKVQLVQVGAGNPLFRFDGIDVDLSNKTSIPQLLDISSGAAGFVGQVSFIIPLAESFDKPSLILWSRKGLNDPDQFINRVTPRKILHKQASQYVIDDCAADEIDEKAHALLRRIGSAGSDTG